MVHRSMRKTIRRPGVGRLVLDCVTLLLYGLTSSTLTSAGTPMACGPCPSSATRRFRADIGRSPGRLLTRPVADPTGGSPNSASGEPTPFLDRTDLPTDEVASTAASARSAHCDSPTRRTGSLPSPPARATRRALERQLMNSRTKFPTRRRSSCFGVSHSL